MSMSKKSLLRLVEKLAALRGGGVMAEDWIGAFGEDIIEILEAAPDPAGVVHDWVMRAEFRPVPAALARMVDEQRQARGQAQAEQREQGCPDCVSGYRTGRTLRRMPNGELVVREAALPCTCSRGMAIARGIAEGRGGLSATWTWKEQAERLRAERLVTRASRAPGLVAWDITDADWTQWHVQLYADPEAEQELRDRAARRGEVVARAMVREGARPRAPRATWHDEVEAQAEAGAW